MPIDELDKEPMDKPTNNHIEHVIEPITKITIIKK